MRVVQNAGMRKKEPEIPGKTAGLGVLLRATCVPMRLRRLLPLAFFIPLLSSPARVAEAQLDPGYLFLRLIDPIPPIGPSSHRPGTSTSIDIGSVLVPERGAGATSYGEYWSTPPSLLPRHDGSVVEIVPVPAEAWPATAMMQLPTGPSDQGFQATADEVDLESANDLEGLLDDESLLASDSPIVTEIWQRSEGGPEAGSFERVGIICGATQEKGVLVEGWLVSDRYVYPSSHASVRTQLRPVDAGGATARALFESSYATMGAARYIRVVTPLKTVTVPGFGSATVDGLGHAAAAPLATGDHETSALGDVSTVTCGVSSPGQGGGPVMPVLVACVGVAALARRKKSRVST